MNLSSTSSLGLTSTSSSLSLSTSTSTLHPNSAVSSTLRRRSVDTGGLNLVVNDHTGSGSGRGYGGWVEYEEDLSSGPLDVANLVIALREETNNVIDQAHPRSNPSHISSSERNSLKGKYIRDMAKWHFDASHLPLDEVLLCTNILFELLWTIEGMQMAIGLTFDHMPPFLARVSKIYREGSSYHNFQHALDVLQATYFYLQGEGCVPSILCLLDREPLSAVELESEERGSNLPGLWVRPQVTLLQRTLRNEDLFALFIAAIGHDIGHPGVSNAFLKNAKTPLAELFSEDSVLEKMHCTLLLQTMRKHGMSHLLDSSLEPSGSYHSTTKPRPSLHPYLSVQTNGAGSCDVEYKEPLYLPPSKSTSKEQPSVSRSPSEAVGTSTDFRALLVRTILATDMSVHSQWMSMLDEFHERHMKFKTSNNKNIAKTTNSNNTSKMTNKNHQSGVSHDKFKMPNNNDSAEIRVDSQTRLLLCQALLKCADISNPSRPPPACEHWSTSLITEWMEQAFLERKFELPVSVSASKDPKTEAQGQIGFIKACTLPLLEATAQYMPTMITFRDQCRRNLIMWQDKIDEIDANAATINDSPAQSTAEDDPNTPLSLPVSPPDITTMFALSLPPAVYTPGIEYRNPIWSPVPTSISPLRKSTGENSVVVSVNVRTNGTIHSEPASPSVVSDLPLFPRRQLSHAELPQIPIPNEGSCPSRIQTIKSGSTMSPLPPFSPRSCSSSDDSSPTPSLSTIASITSHSRETLRAVYDAHGRSKNRKWENRVSWSPANSYNVNSVLDPSVVPQETSSGS